MESYDYIELVSMPAGPPRTSPSGKCLVCSYEQPGSYSLNQFFLEQVRCHRIYMLDGPTQRLCELLSTSFALKCILGGFGTDVRDSSFNPFRVHLSPSGVRFRLQEA